MRPGKISESVLKRSVLKQIKTKREEIAVGAGVGTDCSFFVPKENEGCVLTTCAISIEPLEELGLQIRATVNNVAAFAGEPLGILSSLILPDKILESKLQSYTGEIERLCKELNLQNAGGNTLITEGVKVPILNLTVFGKKENKVHEKFYRYEEGDEIILTKWAGLAGTSLLARREEYKLKERLPAYIIDTAKSWETQVSVLEESRIAIKHKIAGMHDVSRGGIFAALWELVEEREVGFNVDLRKIPMRQETIEICEILEKNPYELYGAGALLMVTKNSSLLLSELEKEKIPAAVIGRITGDGAKVILNGEEQRFLERPKAEALY